MQRFVRWYRQGHFSCKGYCFDIGGTTRAALEAFERSGDPFSGPVSPDSAGNGSLMRLAPVPLAYYRYPERAIALSGESSRTTHGATEAVDACRYFGGLLVGALQGVDKADLLDALFAPQRGFWDERPLAPNIVDVASGSFHEKTPPAIRGTGYVVQSLEAALWAFRNSDDFETGALLAVNLGDDADTTGAIYGQIAGAFYGVEGIPSRWREKRCDRAVIEQLAAGLYTLSQEAAELTPSASALENADVRAQQ